MVSSTGGYYVTKTKKPENTIFVSRASAQGDVQMVGAAPDIAWGGLWPRTEQIVLESYPVSEPIPATQDRWELPRNTMLRLEVARLMEQVAELEEEIEAIQTSFAHQEFLILDGYIVSVRPGLGVPFAAECPRLRSVAQGDTLEETLADLQEAMNLFVACRRDYDKPIPQKDVEAR